MEKFWFKKSYCEMIPGKGRQAVKVTKSSRQFPPDFNSIYYKRLEWLAKRSPDICTGGK